MRIHDNELSLSATDLSHFLSCRHRTALDMAVARGKRKKHYNRPDPLLEILWKRGLEHERRYIESLETTGRTILDLSAARPDRAMHLSQTLDAMRAGTDVIVQGALCDGRWFGMPDVMLRVDTPSGLGGWSYEIADTKLARETRAGTILQLGLYSQMLANAQGMGPEHFYVVTPDPVCGMHEYRTGDYAAYFRLMCARMQETVALDHDVVAAAWYPEPVDHCEICPWCRDCKDRRRRDDHLSLVAGITRLQRRELESHSVATLSDLSKMPLPLSFKPSRGSRDSYERVREQARLQFESRDLIPPLHELRAFAEGLGLGRLPEPSPGDLFLDLEGDPFAAEGGREYLFGIVSVDGNGSMEYRSFWAFTEHDERLAFESVMDLIGETASKHPGMHVYHYAPYEPSAFKRLMGRYATREDELDSFLRSERFVDLYGVVRQGLIAGVERYSIKNLEVFYGFDRVVDLADANRNLRIMEQGLELKSPELIPQEVRDAVEGYNRDDCISTLKLRDWLEGLRTQLIASGTAVSRPEVKEGDPSQQLDEKAQRVEDLRARLLRGVPDARDDQSEEQHARWLLAYMLDWHRREDKAAWWEYFRLCALPEEDLFDESEALAGLEHVVQVQGQTTTKTGKPKGLVTDRYRYPAQEMEIGRRDELKLQDGSKFGDVVAVDRVTRTIDIKKVGKHTDYHPTAVFAHSHISTAVQEQALFRLGECVAAEGSIADGKCASATVARDLLMKRRPRLSSVPFSQHTGETPPDFAARIGLDLDESFLAIQGPPGSGKTFTGAKMICALVADGKKIGVTANSHKVIRNLLDAVATEAGKCGAAVRLGQKVSEDDPSGASSIESLRSNDDARHAIQSGEAQVLGGTAWMWAREDFAGAIDVLFVDEAGQMSLADVLAVSGAAKNVVLLGDPQQLRRPQKGSHPEGVDASALEHILGVHRTIPEESGIFLPVTWRLHPDICSFTSELFYESRLHPKPSLENQRVSGVDGIEGSGLWIVPVDHDGNRNASVEEVEVVAGLIARFIAPGSRWTNEKGEEQQMTTRDILVVSPYNAQVTRLAERIGAVGVRIGTVDKFQGQEAPVVIYSAATSRPEDAPRGMEFLYSLNRLNVATSRAKCAAIIVANPRLFEPECQTPRQMKLANALCRYREMAKLFGNGKKAIERTEAEGSRT